MHIHAGHLNSNLHSSSGASEATLAARRAEAVRKRLLGESAEAQGVSDTQSPWMVEMAQAWGGSGGASGQPPEQGSSSHEEQAVAPVASVPSGGGRPVYLRDSEATALKHLESAQPVSFWV